ncbi:MAG TPA: chorismate lyase [Steroidobacteraceae bacterium]|nr:chorismate lyase [Steroidobacteraceae bacterium]
MTPQNLRKLDPVRWLPAERLGQLDIEAHLRPWLIGKGLLSLRMKDRCGDRFAAHLVDQWTGLLGADLKDPLKVQDSAGLFRDEELCCGDQVWVFVQTVVPDSTLCMHPWLGELGDSPVGEILSDLAGLERSSYEYARLPAGDPLSARALRDTDLAPSGLWARRSRILLRGLPILSQEAFLPAMGRTPSGA